MSGVRPSALHYLDGADPRARGGTLGSEVDGGRVAPNNTDPAVHDLAAARLDAVARHCGALPARRRRIEDDILGYDERGLPGAW